MSSIKATPVDDNPLPQQSPQTSSTFFTWHRSGPEQISLPRGKTTPATGTTSPRPCLRCLYGHRRRRPEIFPRGETGIRAGNDPSRCPGDQWVCITSLMTGGVCGNVLAGSDISWTEKQSPVDGASPISPVGPGHGRPWRWPAESTCYGRRS